MDTFAAIVCLFTEAFDIHCMLPPSSAMTRLCFPVDIDDRCHLPLSAETRLCLHASIYDCCVLPSSAVTRLCLPADLGDRYQLSLLCYPKAPCLP